MEKRAVRKNEFEKALLRFTKAGKYGLDTETFGLRWHDEHNLFSTQLSDDAGALYFNFLDKPDHNGNLPDSEFILPRAWLVEFSKIFSNPDSTWFIHNAKFDLGMLSREGLYPTGNIHCTEAVARVVDPRHRSYRLSECMARMSAETREIGFSKSDVVWDYIIKNKLFDEIKVPGKDKPIIAPYFNLVPFDLLVDYGCQDTIACRKLGLYQENRLHELRNKSVKITDVAAMEKRLTKTLLMVEINGMPLDVSYTSDAQNFAINKIKELKEEYRAYAGVEYVGSADSMYEAYFKDAGIEFPTTNGGNLSATKYVLKKIVEETQDPVAQIVLDLRRYQKLVNTYYSNYLYYYSRKDSAIHPSIKQGGTITGRMSMLEPNLQNVPKPPEEDEIDEDSDSDIAAVVRRCFKPPHGQCFFMPDYDQMEYRLMIDQAGEKTLIDMVNSGLDVHVATAEMMSDSSRKVSRKEAKTINFMLLYGGGIAKLSNTLGISEAEAKYLKARYFERLPNVQKWIRLSQDQAKFKLDRLGRPASGGYCVNWFGRYAPIDRGFEYKAPNYKIQGGSADICKIAMNLNQEFLEQKKAQTKMRLQVHDELIFTIPENELDLCKQIVRFMETAYKPINGLSLTAGSAHSWYSWGDKIDGYPTPETRKES